RARCRRGQRGRAARSGRAAVRQPRPRARDAGRAGGARGLAPAARERTDRRRLAARRRRRRRTAGLRAPAARLLRARAGRRLAESLHLLPLLLGSPDRSAAVQGIGRIADALVAATFVAALALPVAFGASSEWLHGEAEGPIRRPVDDQRGMFVLGDDGVPRTKP